MINIGEDKQQIVLSPVSNKCLIGLCDKYLSKREYDARELNVFEIATAENPRWQPMACHFRNIEYVQQNIRTFEVLRGCFDCICQEYLPYYRKIFNDQSPRKRLELFLYDRVRSIRCELHVQNIIDPVFQIKIFKLILFLESMMGKPVEICSLQDLICDEIRNFYNQLPEGQALFEQCFLYSIYIAKKEKLLQLLQKYQNDIDNSVNIQNAIKIKTRIQNGNYIQYFQNLLSHSNVYVRLILWSQISTIRQIFIKVSKKAKINQKAGFVCKVMGRPKMEGWIDLSKHQDIDKFDKNKIKIDLDVKLWIFQSTLLATLEELQQNLLN